MNKKTTTIVLETIATIAGLLIWIGLAFFSGWYIFGGVIGFAAGIFITVTLSWLGERTGYWPSVDVEDFKIYGWIPLWFW